VAETLPDGRVRLDHSPSGWDRARGQRGDGSSAKLTLAPLCADSEHVDTIAPILAGLAALVVAVAALLRAARGQDKDSPTAADLALQAVRC